MFKLGLVGFGNWGSKYVAAVKESGQAEISIACRRDINKFSREFQLASGIHTTDSFQCVLDQKPDGIIIASGPDTHVEYALKCIERRIPFIIEKPLAILEKDCLTIIRKAQEARFPFQINHVHLFDPAYLKFRVIVRSWKSSRLTISSRGENRGPFRSYSSYHDYSPHDISMILGLLDTDRRKSISNFGIEHHKTEVGSLYRITMGSPYMESSSWVGNGATSRARSLLAINNDTGDYACYFADQSAQRPVVLLNGLPQFFDLDSPLVCSIRAFCTMISHEEIDWRYHFDLYEQIYHMAAELT